MQPPPDVIDYMIMYAVAREPLGSLVTTMKTYLVHDDFATIILIPEATDDHLYLVPNTH